MNIKIYVIVIILLILGFSSCDLVYLLDLLEADSQIFIDIFNFGLLSGCFLFILFSLVFDTLFLISRKIRKSLEKQGKE